MSDVYSDLNIKNGAKIVLGESGVSIDSSGCVVLDSGCIFGLSDVATRCYVDEEISKICTDGSVSGCFLPATKEDAEYGPSFYNVDKRVQFSDYCIYFTSYCEDKGRILFSPAGTTEQGVSFIEGGQKNESSFLCLEAGCISFRSNEACFQFPLKNTGTYTLATTDDISSGGTVSGDYLQLNSTEKQNITSPVQFDGSVYLNDGGCGIIMSNCEAFVYSNATFRLPEVTSGRYTLATTDNISTGYLKLCCSSTQSVCGTVCFEYIKIGYPIEPTINNCFVHYNGATFQLPNKNSGVYTLATTEDISGSGSGSECGSGCVYPKCYPLYDETCSIVGVLCYDRNYGRLSLNTYNNDIYVNTVCGGSIQIDSYRDVIINAGCSIFFSNDTSAFCMFVPSHLPYMEGTIESTIVTSPGYSESGCGLQICVLTQSEYSSMSQHGMTTLYFIKPEN